MIFCSNYNTLMPENIEKTCTYDVNKAKSHYYDTQKMQIIYAFLLKSRYYDAQKYSLLKQNHIAMILKKY